MDKKDKIFIIIFILIIVGITMISLKTEDESKYGFKIYFFNAGKADAIVLSKDNKYMMIDTGEEILYDEIDKYFKDNNITKLDYLIITHFDKDHVGSASKIIDNYEIGEVLQSNVEKDSIYYNNYINSLKNKNISPIIVSDNKKIDFSDLDITINGPTNVYENNESNNSSLIVSIKYQNNSFLFMGDAQNARIKDYLKIDDKKYDFLKVPYHGHYLKRLEEILKNLDIKSAVITSGNDELEDPETLDVLNQYGVKYYLTRKGNITVLSDGNEILVKQ